jgi:hypothetical protein
MDISCEVLVKFLGLEVFFDGGRPDGGPVSHPILLTSLTHVNGRRARIPPRRIQNSALGGLPSSVHALELTVPHKTVAEPH